MADMIPVDIIEKRVCCIIEEVWKGIQNAGIWQYQSRVNSAYTDGTSLRRIGEHPLRINLLKIDGGERVFSVIVKIEKGLLKEVKRRKAGRKGRLKPNLPPEIVPA